MVFEFHLLTELVKPPLKLQSVVRLEEDGFEGKLWKDRKECTHGTIFIEMVQDDGLLVAGEDIDEGILKARPGETGKLWCHILDIHLEVADGWRVFGVHVDGPRGDREAKPTDEFFCRPARSFAEGIHAMQYCSHQHGLFDGMGFG